jgi:hypothetical protein
MKPPHANITTSQWHTTHPQPQEQLLVGWIAGGMTTTTTDGDDNNNDRQCLMTPTMTAPLTTTMSNCSWGGNRVQ